MNYASHIMNIDESNTPNTLKTDLIIYEIVSEQSVLGAELVRTVIVNNDVFRLIKIRLTREMMRMILAEQDCEF